MNSDRHSTFHFFRYQLLPISQHFQVSFDPPISSLEELLARKNVYFKKVLEEIEQFEHSRSEVVHRILANERDIIVFQLGANRSLQRTARDFTEERLDNWPTVLVAFQNNPHVQKVAIEKNYQAFYRTTTVVEILERTINRRLAHYQLASRFMPIFEEHKFWDIVQQYPERIVQSHFLMISPNMANISSSLRFDLADLSRATNTQETQVALESDKGSHLTLSQDNDFISSLVRYASEGGGNITLKIKGIRRRIKTANSVTEVSIREAEFKDADPATLVSLFREVFRSD
jgi:hypothetical protein